MSTGNEAFQTYREPGETGAGKIKLFSGPGTRQWPRYDMSEIPLIRNVSSNACSLLKIINISKGGALLGARNRLVPHTRVRLKLQTDAGTARLTAFVLRSEGSPADTVLRFQAAVAFDSPFHLLDKLTILETLFSHASGHRIPLSVVPKPGITEGSGTLHGRNADKSVIESFLAVDILCDQNEAHAIHIALNDW